MSGIRGRSGGRRAGSGRKKLPPEKLNTSKPISVTEVSNTAEGMAKAKLEKTIQVMQTCDMRELVCPIEFESMPYAKKTWEYVLELDKNSKYHLLNERHYESLKSYALAVEVRQNLIDEWNATGKPSTITTRQGELKINPIVTEISRMSDRINNFAEDLGLTVMSEFKMAKEKQTSPTLNGETKKESDDMFD